MTDNKQVYNTVEVVSTYTSDFKLFAAEKLFLQQYAKELETSRFLDIGIGGGRTTYFIAPKVKSYYGVDYSEAFVVHVAQEYKGNDRVVIEFGDARDLKQYEDRFFDFILFSFNGIDCVGFEDRRLILRECFRMLKPKGHFWFSFHNIHSLPKLYSFQWPKNPLNWPKEYRRSRMVKQINGDLEQYVNKDYCILRDGADFFETEVMYLKPALQIALLKEVGFADIRLYNAQTGKSLSESETLDRQIDWIYVDCVKTS